MTATRGCSALSARSSQIRSSIPFLPKGYLSTPCFSVRFTCHVILFSPTLLLIPNTNSKSIVIIDTDGEKNFVPLSDLLYISSMKENKLHLRYQLTDRALISKGTLSKAEKRLSSHGFVSPSRGFLVNLHHIRSINSTRLLLNNGFELPISRRRSKELQNIYSQHIINIL